MGKLGNGEWQLCFRGVLHSRNLRTVMARVVRGCHPLQYSILLGPAAIDFVGRPVNFHISPGVILADSPYIRVRLSLLVGVTATKEHCWRFVVHVHCVRSAGTARDEVRP